MKWINAEERLPEINTTVLILYKVRGAPIVDTGFFDGRSWYSTSSVWGSTNARGVIYWIGIPKLPEILYEVD